MLPDNSHTYHTGEVDNLNENSYLAGNKTRKTKVMAGKNALLRYKLIDDWLQNKSETMRTKAVLRKIYENHEIDFSDRTFQQDLKFLEEEFLLESGVEIEKKNIPGEKNGIPTHIFSYCYSEPDFSAFRNGNPKRMTEVMKEAYDSLSLFKGTPGLEWINDSLSSMEIFATNTTDLEEIVSFENNANLKGLEYLKRCFEAIKDKKVINIETYSVEDGYNVFVVSPVYLKQFNKRWYLLGFTTGIKDYDKGKRVLYQFPLDGIVKFSENPGGAYNAESIDWATFFNEMIGITNKRDKRVETIRLKITNEKAATLLENNPLHKTQETLWDDDHKNMELTLKVKVNRELVNSLLRYADSVTILEPTELKDQFKAVLQQALAHNA